MEDPFRHGVVALIPHLRAYATTLTRSRSDADDLVQETLMRAWRYRDSFHDDGQLKAWLFKILRNRFYTHAAERRWLVQDVDGAMAATLVSPPEQLWWLEFQELLTALGRLSADTREAITLVLAAGLSYEDAASVCGCAVGTMKSRVNRGRTLLSAWLDPPAPPSRTAARSNAAPELAMSA